MEGSAQRIGRLARDLCPGKPLGEKGRAASGVSVFQQLEIIQIKVNVVSLDSTCIKVHPDGIRALKRGPESIGRTLGGWNTKLRMAAASGRNGVMFSPSVGNRGDGPEGRALLQQLGLADHPVYLLMGRAYEGDETRALSVELGYIPVVPLKSNHKNTWD